MQEHYFWKFRYCARFNQSETRMCMEIPFQKGTRTTSPAYITEAFEFIRQFERDRCPPGFSCSEGSCYCFFVVCRHTLTTHRKLREMGVQHAQNGHLLTHGEIYGLLGRLLRKVIFALLSARSHKCDVSVNTIKNNLQTF